jgi:hypothetical protein
MGAEPQNIYVRTPKNHTGIGMTEPRFLELSIYVACQFDSKDSTMSIDENLRQYFF